MRTRILSELAVQWTGWGNNGYLAMLIDGSIWFVQVSTAEE